MKFISFISATTILIWILPLGAFIGSSQEKKACDGRRAFHMCSMGAFKIRKDAQSGRISFTNASNADKTNKSASSSGGNDFTNSHVPAKVQNKASRFFKLDLIFSKQLFFPVPFPIPKA
jgi:hypothetical protein